DAGVGAFYLDQEGLHYNITLFGTDTIKSAHIYSGKLGVEIAYNRRYYKSIREFHYQSATGLMKFSDTTEALTPDLVDQLLKDELFVNIRTTRDTLGGIRGQLIMAGGTAFRAALNAKQEGPAVKSNASGTANFLLTDQGLSYQISVDSIVVASSHFHMAPAGQAGGVVKDITSSYANGTASGTWLKSGDQSLTADLIKSLLMGNIYVNVHSPAYPAGEIRGQVLLNEGWGFAAQLNGVQVVPSSASTGAGTGTFILTPAGLKYDLTLTGVTPVQTTINNAPVSQNGPVLHDITSGFNSGMTGHDVLLFDNSDSTKSSLISSMLNNNLYVTVNTAAFAGGEIRGQISRTVTGALVSVKSTDNILPGSFELKQNYPNPFNPSTKIKFSIPEFSQVELTVFNVIGEKLATLVKKEMSAGNYEVQFDASRLPSGMYIYRLQTGRYVSERKMMLIK
ncbi:MAG: CHRD domain-containing protein, partial [Syntrophothermus sp.]